MKCTRFALSALALACGLNSQAATFSNIYVFGDSLSDGGAYVQLLPPGTGRFTTNPDPIWAEQLAQNYGLTATAGVNNFAMGGAQVNTTPGFGAMPTTFARSIARQVEVLLAAPGPLDSKALYSVWGGANDIFYQFQFAGTSRMALMAAMGGDTATASALMNEVVSQATATQGPGAAGMQGLAGAMNAALNDNNVAQLAIEVGKVSGLVQQNVIRAATDLAAQVALLKQAGARYIIVPNLPSIGDTPGGAQGDDEQTQAASRATFNSLSALYNTTLAAALRQANVEVIGLNINGITREIMANPGRYGLLNVSSPACLVPSSLICTDASLVSPSAANTYFFADGVHPTGTVHAMLAQYAAAVIDGPQQMAQLSLIGLQNGRIHRQLLNDRLQVLRRAGSASESLAWYAEASRSSGDQEALDGGASTSGDSSVISVGGERRMGAQGYLGFAATGNSGSQDFSGNRGSVDVSDVGFSLYGGWMGPALYAQAYAQVALQDYSNIVRRVNIGLARYLEQSDTHGVRVGMGAEAGYQFRWMGLQTGPLLGLHYQHVTVENFHEKAADSVAMSFDEQSVASILARLGWSVATEVKAGAFDLQPFAELALENEFGQDERKVRGGLTSLGTQFSMPVQAMDGNWLDYRLGVQAQHGRWQGSFSYRATSGMEMGEQRSVNLQVGRSF